MVFDKHIYIYKRRRGRRIGSEVVL